MPCMVSTTALVVPVHMQPTLLSDVRLLPAILIAYAIGSSCMCKENIIDAANAGCQTSGTARKRSTPLIASMLIAGVESHGPATADISESSDSSKNGDTVTS